MSETRSFVTVFVFVHSLTVTHSQSLTVTHSQSPTARPPPRPHTVTHSLKNSRSRSQKSKSLSLRFRFNLSADDDDDGRRRTTDGRRLNGRTDGCVDTFVCLFVCLFVCVFVCLCIRLVGSRVCSFGTFGSCASCGSVCSCGSVRSFGCWLVFRSFGGRTDTFGVVWLVACVRCWLVRSFVRLIRVLCCWCMARRCLAPMLLCVVGSLGAQSQCN